MTDQYNKLKKRWGSDAPKVEFLQTIKQRREHAYAKQQERRGGLTFLSHVAFVKSTMGIGRGAPTPFKGFLLSRSGSICFD